MIPVGEESLHGVVEGSDSRREPESDWRSKGQLGVVHDGMRQTTRVPQADLVARLVGHTSAGGELSDRERRGHSDMRQGRCTVSALAYVDCDYLGRVDRA